MVYSGSGCRWSGSIFPGDPFTVDNPSCRAHSGVRLQTGSVALSRGAAAETFPSLILTEALWWPTPGVREGLVLALVLKDFSGLNPTSHITWIHSILTFIYLLSPCSDRLSQRNFLPSLNVPCPSFTSKCPIFTAMYTSLFIRPCICCINVYPLAFWKFKRTQVSSQNWDRSRGKIII